MVKAKALALKTDRGSACRFDSLHGQFFNDDGVAARKARALMRVQSTKPEGVKRPKM